MRAAFREAEAFSGDGDLKRAAWDQFLAAFTADNPYSSEDETLRAEARKRRAAVEVAVVAPPPPKPPPRAKEVVGVFPKTFKDCADCPQMVVVPAGRFRMGSPSGESGRDTDEGPVHDVRIGRFALGKYEVTNAEFVAFLNVVGRRGNKGRPWFETKAEDSDSRIVAAENARYGVEPGYERHPVIEVSWHGARAYADWLSRKTGREYRLPSEAEWEYATRGNTTTRYWWGHEIGRDNANCDGCGSRWDNTEPAPVDSFRANPFGLHNVHGNVWEWVADCY